MTKPPAHWPHAFRAVYDRLERNLGKPGFWNPHHKAYPSPKYPSVYLWDSAFISLIWKIKDAEIAQDVIRSVLYHQKPDGRISHAVSPISESPWTQPPVLSWAAAEILKVTKDKAFAREIYPKLKRYHDWLESNRKLENGLFFWGHAYESGIDNSPRFGNRDESYYVDTTKLAAIDMTSFVILDAKSLIEIAKVAEREDDVFELERMQTETSLLVQKLLWDEETGYFYDLDLTTNKLVKIPTVASFFPLIAKAASEQQFLRLREHAANPEEFNTLMPMPTVARNSPKFEKDMWRGPVWVNTAYLVIKGFEQYGESEFVKELSQKLVDAVYRTWENTGQLLEFYDPDRTDTTELSRKRGLGPFGLSGSKSLRKILHHLILKQMILGKKPVGRFCGWTGLVNTLVIEELGYSLNDFESK